MSEGLRKYEMLYIMPGNLPADGVEAVDQIYGQIIEKFDGELLYREDWGVRTLAYPVKKNAEGRYVLLRLACSPACLDELERRFKISEAVIKYLSVRLPDDFVQPENEAADSVDEDVETESGEAQDEKTEASAAAETQTAEGQGE